jgi:hypothetical protein
MGDKDFMLAGDGWAGRSSLVRECVIALVEDGGMRVKRGGGCG